MIVGTLLFLYTVNCGINYYASSFSSYAGLADGTYTVEELENAVRDFVDAEEAVKTGTLGDVLSVELLIVKYSSARAVRA